MRPPTIACIVEGHGEVSAVPILLNRIALDVVQRPLNVIRPLRHKRDQLARKPEKLARSVEQAVRLQGGGPGGVLILLDTDRDLPCELGPRLQARAQAVRPDRVVRVALAVIEYEAWFLAAASSLAGVADLPEDLTPPDDPESIRNAKGWLGDRMRPRRGGGYSETIDQPLLTRHFDLQAARRTASFRKLCREVARLARAGPA